MVVCITVVLYVSECVSSLRPYGKLMQCTIKMIVGCCVEGDDRGAGGGSRER